MPRLLLLLHLIALVLLVNTAPVRACSFERLSDEQLFSRASTVFVARIVRTDEATGLLSLSDKPEAIVEASFRVIEVLKGQPPQNGKVKSRAWGGGNCSVPLVAATDYLFFLHGNEYVLLPGGSRIILLEGVQSVVGETESVLERLRALSDRSK